MKSDTTLPPSDGIGVDLDSAVEFATPDLYAHNPFRVLELGIEAGEREVTKRRVMMETAARNRLPVPRGSSPIFPPNPAPDDQEIRNAFQALQEPDQRLMHEFFWFWPLESGTGSTDAALRFLAQGDEDSARNLWRSNIAESAAARHNRAIVGHFGMIERERQLLVEAGDPDDVNLKDLWAEAFSRWRSLLDDERCWSRVTERIRAIDDPRLRTGAARTLQKRLPIVLGLISYRFAIKAIEAGHTTATRRYLDALRESGLPGEALEEASRHAIGPVHASLKTQCDAAMNEARAEPKKGATVSERLLTQSGPRLNILDAILPASHAARVADHDQIAQTVLACQVSFANATEDWATSERILRAALGVAASKTVRNTIEENLGIIGGNKAARSSSPVPSRSRSAPTTKHWQTFPGHPECWFCKNNPPDAGSAFVSCEYSVSSSRALIRVPRCAICEGKANAKQKAVENCVFQIWFALLVFFLVLLAAANKVSHDFGFLVGLISSLIYYFAGNAIDRSLKRYFERSRSFRRYPDPGAHEALVRSALLGGQTSMQELVHKGWEFESIND